MAARKKSKVTPKYKTKYRVKSWAVNTRNRMTALGMPESV